MNTRQTYGKVIQIRKLITNWDYRVKTIEQLPSHLTQLLIVTPLLNSNKLEHVFGKQPFAEIDNCQLRNSHKFTPLKILRVNGANTSR